MNMPAPCSVLAQVMSVGADEVHVWHATLDLDPSEVTRLEQTLAHDEVARGARFNHAIDRQRFICRRGILRAILSRYTDESPGELEFCYGPHGKPRLKTDNRTHPLRFNVSHSEGLAVFAIANEREIGVDVERFQTGFEWEEIAASFFSADELSVLHSLPVQDRYHAFLRAWTCKEACAKARGDGLSLPLEQLVASQAHGSWSLHPSRSPDQRQSWTLKTLTPLPGYAGAVAVEGTGWQITCGQWRE